MAPEEGTSSVIISHQCHQQRAWPVTSWVTSSHSKTSLVITSDIRHRSGLQTVFLFHSREPFPPAEVFRDPMWTPVGNTRAPSQSPPALAAEPLSSRGHREDCCPRSPGSPFCLMPSVSALSVHSLHCAFFLSLHRDPAWLCRELFIYYFMIVYGSVKCFPWPSLAHLVTCLLTHSTCPRTVSLRLFQLRPGLLGTCTVPDQYSTLFVRVVKTLMIHPETTLNDRQNKVLGLAIITHESL